MKSLPILTYMAFCCAIWKRKNCPSLFCWNWTETTELLHRFCNLSKSNLVNRNMKTVLSGILFFVYILRFSPVFRLFTLNTCLFKSYSQMWWNIYYWKISIFVKFYFRCFWYWNSTTRIEECFCPQRWRRADFS